MRPKALFLCLQESDMTTQTSRLVIEIDSRNAERNTRAVANELENLTTKGIKADTQMTEMSSSIKILVGYMGGLLTINKAIAMADGYTQMAARIRNATISAEEYTLVQDRLLANANTTYRQLGEAQEVYLSMAGGMKSLGKTTKDTLDLTDSLSFSFTHNATRVDQAQSAMDALSKSMAKGKVDGDAWISIVTGADNIISDMTKHTEYNEKQIREMGAGGKIALEDLIKTLILTRDENEKLANNMENSLADGFTKLSNEVTVYLGKANEATSATGMLAGGLSDLANNLEAIANTGAVLGIGYVTSALLTKGAAVKAGMVLSAQKQVADRAELVSQTQLTGAEVRRTASLAQFTTMQLADAKATAARMTGMQRLAYVQSTVIPLEAKATQATAVHTVATTADTVAQEINNKARSRGAMLLGLVGGPIGAITVGVMALSAGYAYMSHRTAEANAKLEEQGKVAQKTDEELKKLAGNDKKSAVEDLTAAFNAQNAELAKSKESVDAVLFAIRATSAENEKARKVTEDARRGVISYDKAIKQLNAMDIPTDLYEMLKKQAKEYDNNADKAGNSQRVLKIFGIEVKLAGNAAQNAVDGLDSNSNAMRNNADATNAAVDAQSKYISNLQKGAAQTIMTNKLIAKGWDIERAKMASQAAFDNGGKVSAKDIQIIDMNIVANKKLQASEDIITNAKRESAKASKVALTQQKKEAKELERDTRQALEDAKSLIYDYTSEFTRIETDLKNEIEKINNSSLKSDSKTKMIGDARTISEARKKLYATELDFELNEYSMSEAEKLKAQTNIKKLRVDSTKGLLVEERKLKKDSADKESAHELGLIQLAKEQRIFQMQQGLMSANTQSERYWELERIRITRSVQDLEERNQQLAIANALQAEEKRTNLNTAVQQWGGINAEMTGTTDQFNFEKERFDRLDASQALFDAELAMAGENYALKEQAYQAYVDRMIAIENAYQMSSVQLQLGYGEQMASSMSTMMGAIFGEKSKAYAAAFAVEKAFAVAQAALAMGQNIAQASKMGFPYNIPMIAGAMAQGAQIASIISSVAQPPGYADGGFTGAGGKFDPAGIVHKGEVVWSQEDIKRWGGVNVVEAMRTSQPPKGYSDGGLVTPQDTYRIGMGTVDAINRGADVQAERQAQANVKAGGGSVPNVNLNPNFVIVDERESMSDYLFSPDGTKAFVKFFKRNRSALGV